MNQLTTLDLGNRGNTPLNRRLAQIARPDATPLMVAWMKILDDGNRRGVLAGTGGDGAPLRRVTYRPRSPVVKASRRGRGAFSGGAGNNLSSAEYRRLSGPPLAPRGTQSRVITNYRTDYAELRPGYWQVTYWWDDVVSAQGVPFLGYHFRGDGRLPRRDLRGVRPDDERKIERALRAWIEDQVRSYT